VQLRSSIAVLVNRIGSTHAGRLALRKGEGEGEDIQSKVAHLTANPSPSSSPSPRGEAKRAKRIVDFFSGEATRDVRGRFV
jgi:hypothetical protein